MDSFEETIWQTCPKCLGHVFQIRTDGLTCQWGPRPTSPGGDAASGLWGLPGTMNRNGPGWRWARGGEKGTAPSPLWRSSPCPHTELQQTEASYQSRRNNLPSFSCKYNSWPTQSSNGHQQPTSPTEQGTFTPSPSQRSPRQLGNLLLHTGREALRHVSCGAPCRWYPIWQ